MIIRHSIKILEQLSEIEKVIQSIERKMDELCLDIDREELLKNLIEDLKQKK